MTEHVQLTTPACVVLAVPSSGVVAAMPMNDAADVRPCVTEPENVALSCVFVGSPLGAGAEAIAARVLPFVAFAWTSTVHVRPPPVTDVSVRVELVRFTKANTRDPAAATPDVLIVMLLLPALSDFVPRLLSSAIAPGAAPVPLSAMPCGLPGASSVMLTDAVRLPRAVGVKLTVTVHVAFAASKAGTVGQLLLAAKSPVFVPPSVIELIASPAVPLFTVTDWVGLVVPTFWPLKARLVGVKVTAGCVPVPLRPTVCGLPDASSAIETLAVREPVAEGVKETWIEHDPPAASVLGAFGQLLDCA